MIPELRPYDGKELGPYETFGKQHSYGFKIGNIFYQPETTNPDGTGPTHLWLKSIEADGSCKGNGTRLLRHVCWLSFKKDEGRVELEATESSHFFYLKTGFIPKERKFPLKHYISNEISMLEQLNEVISLIKESLQKRVELDKSVEKKIKKLKFELSVSHEKYDDEDEITHEQLLEEESFLKKFFCKSILQKLKTEFYPKDHEITEEELLSEQPFLNGLLENPEQNVSYIQFDFIPRILACMKMVADHIEPRHTILFDTSSFGDIDMELSEEGIERWKADIEGKKRFVPFRRLEPLQKLMTPKQLERLKETFARITEKNPAYFG